MAALLCDEDVDVEVAGGLQLLGHDAITVRDLGLLGAADELVLEIAAELRRIVFTHNTHDFPGQADRWTAEGREYPGVLAATRAPVGVLIRRLESWLGDEGAVSAVKNTWAWLPRVP